MTARGFSVAGGGPTSGFERVASVAELPEGRLLEVARASGAPVCLFNAAGRIGAMAALCTHQAFPMAEGTLQPDGTLQCSWHGARFDCETGRVIEGPAAEAITVYETRVLDGGIWVGPQR